MDGVHAFEDGAKIRAKKIKEKYPNTTVILVPVNNANEFKTKWDSIGLDSKGNSINIDTVEIELHGHVDGDYGHGVGYMSFEDGSRLAAGNSAILDNDTDVLISDLKTKSMDLLYLGSCNSGNLDVRSTGDAFKDQMGGAQEIIGWDGGTTFNYSKGEDEPGGYQDLLRTMKNQPTWYKYVEKSWGIFPTREREGKVWIKSKQYFTQG